MLITLLIMLASRAQAEVAAARKPWHATVPAPRPGLPAVTLDLGYPGPYIPAVNTPVALFATASDVPFDGFIGFHFAVGGRRTIDTPVIARATLRPRQPWTFQTIVTMRRWGAPPDNGARPRELVVEWRNRAMEIIDSQSAGTPPWTTFGDELRPLRIIEPDEQTISALGGEAHIERADALPDRSPRRPKIRGSPWRRNDERRDCGRCSIHCDNEAMRVVFDRFAFDSDRRELHDGTQPVHLGPKAFRLLEILIENSPRALAKQELYESIWQDTVVDESNLAGLINEIRTALGDRSRKPRFIRTVHGFGYAFSGHVKDEAAQPPAGFVFFHGREIPLQAGVNVLGRDASADVQIDDSTVSRRHAAIEIRADSVILKDLESKNGTFLDGHRLIAPVPLREGQTFVLGDASVVFRRSRGPGSTVTLANE